MRRSRIKPMSSRRRADVAARAEVVRQVHERDRTCQAAPVWPDVECGGGFDVHEPLTRARGGNPLDPDQCVLLCHFHHRAVHDNPDRSHELCLLKHAWERS